MEGGADAGPELLLPGESLPGGHLPLPHLQQERGICHIGVRFKMKAVLAIIFIPDHNLQQNKMLIGDQQRG